MLNQYIDTIVKHTNGRFFTVTFKKNDGTERTINGRMGVTRHLKGGTRTTDPDDYLIVYSVADKGYRNINKRAISRIVCDGVIMYNERTE